MAAAGGLGPRSRGRRTSGRRRLLPTAALAALASVYRLVPSGIGFVGAPSGVAEAVNDFFKQPLKLVPAVDEALQPRQVPTDVPSQLTAVGKPGVPRPLWLVIAASVPTGLVWYGAGYKLLAEEELFAHELATSGSARGFGGPGTMGPFVFGLLLGPLAALLGLPGGASWSLVGVVWIYFTQYLLYERVNELYKAKGLTPPLHVWWLIFPGFNLLVGLRQVHFLARFWARERGEEPPSDPVVDFFPFIGCERYTWREFLRRPSMWCSLLKDAPDLDIELLRE